MSAHTTVLIYTPAPGHTGQCQHALHGSVPSHLHSPQGRLKVPFSKEFFITLTSEPHSLPRASLSLFSPFTEVTFSFISLPPRAAVLLRAGTPLMDTRFLHSLRFPSNLLRCKRPAVLAASLGGGESGRGRDCSGQSSAGHGLVERHSRRL